MTINIRGISKVFQKAELDKIPKGWTETVLGEVAEPISQTHDFLGKDKIIFINTGNILAGKFLHREYSDISILPGQAKKMIARNDILFSEIRPINKRYAFVDFEDTADYVVSTKLMVIRAKESIVPEFLYKALISNDALTEFQHIAESRSGTFPQITFDSIRSYPVLLPSFKEQYAIVKILSDFDDKIELNHEMNKTLEAIAQVIFKRWFVEEAENSTAEKLGDILETIESGSRPKGGIDPNLIEGIPSIGAENINGIGFYNYSKTKFISPKFFNNMSRGIVRDYDVLIYKDGAYIGRKSMFGRGFPYEQSCVNEHVFILRTNGRANQVFLYFLLNQEELKQLNANSAQPGLNQESMKSFNVFIPNKIKIDQFGELVKPLIDRIFFNCCQIRSLSQVRDSLLPRLMSGRIRVRKDRIN